MFSPCFGPECAFGVHSSPTLDRMSTRARAFALIVAGTLPIVAGAQGSSMPPPVDYARGLFDGKWAGDVHFDQFSTRAPAQTREKLMELVAKPRQLPPHKHGWCPYTLWALVGHADPSEGGTAAQERVSSARVQYVASLLSLYGVPRAHICALHRGSKQPAGASPSSNRRVEMEVVCQAVSPIDFTKECDAPE